MAIRNNRVVSEVEHRTKDWASGFKEFIMRGNVVDIAVGIVIGAAFTAIVNGMVSDIVTPLIPLPSGSLATLKWPVPYNPSATLNVGAFINLLITFFIIALVIYFFVLRPMNALVALEKRRKGQAHQDTRDCPYCLNSVPYMATRCGHCTSPLPPPQQQPKVQ